MLISYFIQGVPKILVNRPAFDGTGQNNAIWPNFVMMQKVNRGGDRRRNVKNWPQLQTLFTREPVEFEEQFKLGTIPLIKVFQIP